MGDTSSTGHAVTIEVNVEASTAFAFLQDPLMLGKWALGSWDTRAGDSTGMYHGTSLFSGEQSCFRISSDEKLKLVDFHLGDADNMQARISARVIPGAVTGRGDSRCLVTLSAWREAAMSDERWHQLCVCHETEIILLKSLLERS